MMDFPIQTLRKLIDCDPESGWLVWKERPISMFDGRKYEADRLARSWNQKHAGKPALNSLSDRGYLVGTLERQRVQAHRVVFALATGRNPNGEIDHINGDPSDNRISNLREVSPGQNARNMALNRRNTSGVPGVVFRRREKAWSASIGHLGRKVWIGLFPTKDEAITARRQRERELGYSENHGLRKSLLRGRA